MAFVSLYYLIYDLTEIISKSKSRATYHDNEKYRIDRGRGRRPLQSIFHQRPKDRDRRYGVAGQRARHFDALERNGIGINDVSLILITHSHSDHFGSAHELKEMLQVPVAVGGADAKYLIEGKNAPVVPCSPEGHALLRMIQAQGHTNNGLPLPVQPDILIESETDLSKYGVDAEALLTPGHTSGSLSVAIKGGDCVIGDLLVGMPPSNIPELPVLAEDMDAVVASLKKVLRYDSTWLYPAHGNRIETAEARKKFANIIK